MTRNIKKFVLIILFVILLIATFGCFQYAIKDFTFINWNMHQPNGYTGFKTEQLYKFAIVAVPVCVLILCFIMLQDIWHDQEEVEKNNDKKREKIEDQLRCVESMYRAKVIDDVEYKQKKAELLLQLDSIPTKEQLS